ncbi:hypothetical protein BpHYR1_010757, partial [Brachionus plicatilis]
MLKASLNSWIWAWSNMAKTFDVARLARFLMFDFILRDDILNQLLKDIFKFSSAYKINYEKNLCRLTFSSESDFYDYKNQKIKKKEFKDLIRYSKRACGDGLLGSHL